MMRSEIQDERPRVLVVDDDEMHRIAARKALEKSGFDVEEATNGKEGLAAVLGRKPDLMLLDLLMPEMDGLQLCAQLRDQQRFMDIPILIVTGLEDVETIERAFEVGATDFVTKPINWNLLGYHVKYMLRANRMEHTLRETRNLLEIARISF